MGRSGKRAVARKRVRPRTGQQNAACGKVRYASRLEAKAALARARRPGSEGEQQRVYWCEKCNGLHLTSQPRGRGTADG